MKNRLVVVAAIVAFAAGCSDPGTMQVSIDISSISKAVTAGDVNGPGQDGKITLTVTDASRKVLAQKSVGVGATKIEIAVPPGPQRTFSLQVTDRAGDRVYFTAGFTADLIPGGVTNFKMKLKAAIKVTPSTADVLLGEAARFTAASSDGTAPNFVWQVNGTTGGSKTYGTITQGNPAVYSAPATMPRGGTAAIAALYLEADGKTMIGTATVTLVENAGLDAGFDAGFDAGHDGGFVLRNPSVYNSTSDFSTSQSYKLKAATGWSTGPKEQAGKYKLNLGQPFDK